MYKPAKKEKNQTGIEGERIALGWLRGQGFQVLAQNWRHGRLEIDIIASQNGILHFVEVKTLWGFMGLHPEVHVTKTKIKNLKTAAAEYLYHHPQWQKIRFDVIAVTLSKEKEPEIFHIPDIY